MKRHQILFLHALERDFLHSKVRHKAEHEVKTT